MDAKKVYVSGNIKTPAPLPVARASAAVSRAGGTVQASSARAQSSVDDAITKLNDISVQNSQRAQEAADAANRFTREENQRAMEFSAAEAAKNRDWQKMMSDTAHQREVKDLIAAGLNPVLSASGGNGAAVTSGATASSSSGSGQKADTDFESSRGMVTLLSSLLGAQTQLASTAMSAKTNEAIADKTNAMNRMIALITGQYHLAGTELTGEYGLRRQGMSDEAALKRAYVSGEYGLSGKRLDAQAALERLGVSNAFSEYMARNYPNNTVGAIAALLNGLFNSEGKGIGAGINSALLGSEGAKAVSSGEKSWLEALLSDQSGKYYVPGEGWIKEGSSRSRRKPYTKTEK